MVGCVRCMAVGGMGVMGRFPVVAVIVMLGGFAMMMGGVLVVLRGGAMMFSAFVCRHFWSPCVDVGEGPKVWRAFVTAVLQISYWNDDGTERLREQRARFFEFFFRK